MNRRVLVEKIVHEPCRAWSRGDTRTHGWSSAAGHHTALTPQAFPTHCSELPDNRTFPEEFRVYETTAIVQLTREKETTIFTPDPADSIQTIGVEVVDPACALTSPYLSLLTQSRSQYQSLSPLTGKSVRVRGVGFYDFAHGQAGRSRSRRASLACCSWGRAYRGLNWESVFAQPAVCHATNATDLDAKSRA
jgi:hypothetical protein